MQLTPETTDAFSAETAEESRLQRKNGVSERYLSQVRFPRAGSSLRGAGRNCRLRTEWIGDAPVSLSGIKGS